MEWHFGALCAQIDPEIFFPEVGYAADAAQAQAICGMCDVRKECLEFALANREEHGIWGGTTPRERMRMRRRASYAANKRSTPYVNGSNWGRSGQCKRGHDLTPENIIDVSGIRRCRACKLMHSRARAKAVSEQRRVARENRYA